MGNIGPIPFRYRLLSGALSAACGSGAPVSSAPRVEFELPAVGAQESRRRDQPAPFTRAVAIAAGDYHTCALIEGGAVKCWGEGEHGALGYGSTESVGDDETPASKGAVVLGEAATQIVAGPNHTCAVLASGNVRCWGLGPDAAFEFQSMDDNARKVVPHEHRIGDDELPVAWPARNLGSVYKLASGTMGTCAVQRGGGVWCWGPDRLLGEFEKAKWYGQDPHQPFGWHIDFGGQVEDLAIARRHMCALMATGSVRCFGVATDGALGYGNKRTVGDDESPAMVGDVNIGGAATAVGTGYERTCAALVSGHLRCWGQVFRRKNGESSTECIGDDELPIYVAALDLRTQGQKCTRQRLVQLRAPGNGTCAVLEHGLEDAYDVRRFEPATGRRGNDPHGRRRFGRQSGPNRNRCFPCVCVAGDGSR